MKKQTIGERVKLLRDEYRLSQADFARTAGVTLLTIGNLERGVSKDPQHETINNIVRKFGTTHEWLSDGKGEMLPEGKLKFETEMTSALFDPARDTLYKELRDQIMFYRGIINNMTGGKANFLQALNLPSVNKKARLGAAA